MDLRVVEALQQAHDLVADMIKQTANEPSLGLYFVQQHVHKAVPAIIALKEQVADSAQEAELSTEDAKDAISAIKNMKEVGPPVIDRMVKLLNSSTDALQPSRGSGENLGYSVSEIAKDAKKLVLHSSPFRSESPTSQESTNYARNIWDTALDRASSMTRRSSAVDIKQPAENSASVPAAAPATSSSPYGIVRSVLESATQRVGSIGWSEPKSPNHSTKSEEDSNSSSSTLETSKPARYVRAVIDTALMRKKKGAQKAEEATIITATARSGAETETETEQVSLERIEETYDKFQAENAAKLAVWLDEA